MGTRRLRSLWTFGSLVVIFLECSLTASEAPVTNYMSNYYDDAFHEGPSKSKSSPAPSKSHPTQAYSRNGYHHGPEEIEEHHDDEQDHRGEHPHSHKQPHPRDARPPPKHHHHDEEDHQEEPQDHRGPHSKSNSYKNNNNYHGTYNSKPQNYNSPKSHSGKSYGAPPKTPYRSTTTGMPKYITTSGPSYTGGSSSSRLPLNKVPVGSSFSSQTGPGYSYSYGTKITEEREPENHRQREEPQREQYNGPYEESPPPKSTYNMDRSNTFKGTEDFKAGYTAGYPPMSSFNTVKGNFDDYGHNDLSPKSPYKPPYKPVTFSYSAAPTGSEYGSPIEEGPAYDIDDPSYSNNYESPKNYGSPKTKQHKPPTGGKPTSSFFPKNQGKPKPYSSPPPKFDGPPSKHHGPLSKNYGAMKSYSGPPSNTYSTLSAKTFGKHELYHGPPKGFYSPSNGYGPPTGSSSKDNYDSPSNYANPGFSRNPSTSSPSKEHNGAPPTRMGGFQRGSPPSPPSSRGNMRPNNRGSPGRGKRRPNNAYRYSYTAFTMFNKKRPGRGQRQRGKGHYGQGHTHGLAPTETIGYYDGMDDDSEKREQYAQKNKRLFGSVGYSLGDTRTFVKTPETTSIGYSNAATYGGGYDMGTSYY